MPGKSKRKIELRWNPALVRINYADDHRSITGQVFGDPMPDRSALYQRQHLEEELEKEYIEKQEEEEEENQ